MNFHPAECQPPALNSPAMVDLVSSIEASDTLTPRRAAALLASFSLSADALAPWAAFNHPPADSYGRVLVHQGDSYELMVMSWAPGDMSAIHDHGQAQWGAVKVFGPAEHACFAIRDECLVTTSRRRLDPGTVLPVSHQLIHQMGNVFEEPFLTLHLYGGDVGLAGVTSGARIFEPESGQIALTDGGVFYSLPDSMISDRSAGPRGDLATRLRDRIELMWRLMRMSGSLSLGRLQTAREIELAQSLLAQGLAHEIEVELNAHQTERQGGCLRREMAAYAQIVGQLESMGLQAPNWAEGPGGVRDWIGSVGGRSNTALV